MNSRQVGLLLDITLLVGAMSAIFLLSSRPLPAIFFPPISHIDKFYHAAAFSVIGVLWCRVGYRLTDSLFWALWCGCFLGTFYGISDEFHQIFVPGRSASYGDMIADAVGACLGSLAWLWWRLHRNHRIASA